MSDPQRPHGLQPIRLLRPWILQARVLEWGAIEILAYPHAKSHEGHSMEAVLVVLVGYLTWNYTEATIGNGWS